jgi:integrase/recombinase XerC
MGSVSAYTRHLQRRNLRPTYVDAQARTLRRLARFLNTPPVEATAEQLVAFIDSHDQSAGARACEIVHLRTYYAWAVDEGVIPTDPARRLVKPKLPRRLPRPIPDHAIRLALENPPDDVAPILYLALYAGLRACEVAQLRAEDISRDPPLIYITESKGGGHSTVPLAPQLAAALDRYPLPRRGWLFPRLDGKPGHHSRVRIGQLANNYLRDLGIDQRLHQWRHAYGSHLQRVTGGNLRVVQELMRHSDPKSTAIYTALAPAEGAKAVAQLPVFDDHPPRHLRLVT